MLTIIIGTVFAYLTGAIPFAYIFTKATTHKDIRKEGSGNVGATNVLRVAGSKIALLVLVLDILKGAFAVTLLASFISQYTSINETDARFLFSAAVVSGHIWPVFLKFKGGKGVATTLGVCIGLAFYLPEFIFLLLISLAAWIVFFLLTKYVSVGSILAALSLPVGASARNFDFKIVLLCAFLGGVVSLKHHANIRKLVLGTETKIYLRKK